MCGFTLLPNMLHNSMVSTILKECLDTNGLKIEDVGNTYVANHIQKNGNIATSASDHICYSSVKYKPYFYYYYYYF